MSYRAGNVAVAQGSKVVTGTGTLWSIAVTPGDEFVICDANLLPIGPRYEVASVDSNTKLTLVQTYQGTTASGLPYAVLNIVGNMTVPSFAQKLAIHYGKFQSLIDQPNTVPTPAAIPVADSSGKIASGWIKDATTSEKGVVELATTAEAQAGTDATRAVTPAASGSRTTFAVTSTDDATSATSAPLKSAGGLAVAKDAWVGGDIYQPSMFERVFRTPAGAGTYKIIIQSFGGLYDLDVTGRFDTKNRSGFCSYKIHFSAHYHEGQFFFLKEIVPPTNNDGSFSEGFSVTLERVDISGRYAINIMKPDGAAYEIWLRGGALSGVSHYPLTEFIPA